MSKRIFLACIVAFALIAPSALATLQVTSFSCGGQSGTVNIENGGTLVCQATVNNPDADGASINAVTLYPSSSWTEDSSYSASGFSTSISAGASTTATFSGIRPTSSGSNSFGSIYIDAVRDTTVASTTINVMDFKTLAVSSSASSAATGATVTINANVLVGGSVDVTLSISVSSCSLATGETSAKNLGSLSHNSAGSASWQAVMGSSTCSYTVTASGSKGAVSISTAKSSTVSNSDSGDDGGDDGDTPGGSTGGGGGGGATTTTSPTTTTTAKGGAVTTTLLSSATTTVPGATTTTSPFAGVAAILESQNSWMLMVAGLALVAMAYFFVKHRKA